MKTINKFTEADLDAIIGLPLIELSDDWTTFSPSNLGFSVEKRTKVLNCIYTQKNKEDNEDGISRYYLGGIGTPIIDTNLIMTASEMVNRLNNNKYNRWYRLATNEEISYIFMKLFSWNDDIKEYKKMS